jgi:hypothetical protein
VRRKRKEIYCHRPTTRSCTIQSKTNWWHLYGAIGSGIPLECVCACVCVWRYNMFQLRVERILLEIGYASHRSITRGTFFWKTPGGPGTFVLPYWKDLFFLFWWGDWRIALPLVTSVDPSLEVILPVN